MKHTFTQEFPLLPTYGLYAADILGDGNCLFNALSDQLYGSQSKHHELRLRTIDYMRQNKDFFTQFVDVLPGGATRRQPKRKNAGGYSRPTDAFQPTQSDVERAFEEHITRMARGGTWGDNMEIVAFTQAYDVNVMIWRREERYQISAPQTSVGKDTMHIAYHDWEHYSSIRNVDGPHDGRPQIKAEALTPTPERDASASASLSNASAVQPWQVTMVMGSCYFPVSHDAAVRALEAQRCNPNNAVDLLMTEYEAQANSSTQSTQSSSVERDLGTANERNGGPLKKQDRRLSRTTKSVLRHKNQRKKEEIANKLCSQSDDSLDALINAQPAPPRRRGHMRYVVPEDSDSDFETPPPLKDSDTSSSSEYSMPSQSQQPKLTIKLTSNKLKFKAGSPKGPSKNQIPPKRLVSARDKRTVKKQAQKAAAKGRKQLSLNPMPKMDTSSPPPAADQHAANHPTMTTGLKILHI